MKRQLHCQPDLKSKNQGSDLTLPLAGQLRVIDLQIAEIFACVGGSVELRLRLLAKLYEFSSTWSHSCCNCILSCN